MDTEGTFHTNHDELRTSFKDFVEDSKDLGGIEDLVYMFYFVLDTLLLFCFFNTDLYCLSLLND